jgi:nitric oxide reductase NorQ protein
MTHRAVIPYYQEQANEVALYEATYAARLPVMLKGPTGCGKSRFVEYMAWKLNKPLISVACNEDMTASDLLGRYLLEPQGTRWLDGPLTTAARTGAICYLDEIVEARSDTTVVIHPLTDHRRQLPLDKCGELVQAHSTKQRFVGFDFDYPAPELEARIVATESGVAIEQAARLVQIGLAARRLKGHGLDEGISTRLLVYAATLMQRGVAPQDACRMALVRPITDDADIRATLDHAITAVFA